MQKRTRFLTLHFAALLLFVCAAVSAPPSGEELIQRAQIEYEEMESFSCDFTQEFTWKLAQETETMQGTIQIAQGDRYRYETPTQTIVSDGQTLWRYNSSSHQLIIENASEASPGATPRQLLFENPEQFSVQEVVEVEEEDLYRLKLVPHGEILGVDDVVLWVNEKDLVARKLRFVDDAGNTTVYKLTNIKLDEAVAPEAFQFETPEQAEVFDLR